MPSCIVQKVQYHLWDQGSVIYQLRHPWWDIEDVSKKYTFICNEMKINARGLPFDKEKTSLWLGTTFYYGKLSGDAFADSIIISFNVSSEASPIFSVGLFRTMSDGAFDQI